MEYTAEERIHTERHPMTGTEPSFKYLYCFALGVMAMGNMRAITELQPYYDELLEKIQLQERFREQIIVDVNGHLEERLTDVLQQLCRKEERYCLILDLYQMQALALWSEDFCRSIVENYLEVFHLSDVECQFLKTFDNMARVGDVTGAVGAYERFRKQGYEVSYRVLSYFFPAYKRLSRFDGMTIHAGETVVLDGPVEIRGDIIVERGGSLLLYETDLHMQGGIRLQGGRIRFRDAVVQVTGCRQRYFLELQDTTVVQLENTEIDCGGCCGLLSQASGRLIIKNSTLRHSAGASMIRFAGSSALMERTSLIQGSGGLLCIEKAAKMNITRCLFQEGSRDYGGGVYSESIGTVTVCESRFIHCRAKYLGGAVYFKYHKYGQTVKDCRVKQCEPEEQPFFHTYEETGL